MKPSSGDVGNRTRVRKIHPSNIYERSRLDGVIRRTSSDKSETWLAAESRETLFHKFSGVRLAALWLSVARSCLRPESGVGGRDPAFEGQLLFQWLMQPEAEQRM